ncbi:MAG TPA: bifunctional MaoC family dehydratase N-terminal/OB-fold nucleic acid binding domain-containing protein [Acidimicrobiales bacterium]|nr:bifunctional MaoC family dehydratase N-terminal/OB-fold nucleic acid binding domain-containing protein [Acidimicrobiales bacterium]
MTPESAAARTPEAGDDLAEKLASYEGRQVGPPMRAHDPVNQPMIRHWVEAMGDENPVYVDEDAARAAGFSGVIAPATMLQAWIMQGYRATMAREQARSASVAVEAPSARSAQDELFAVLDAAGFTSVVATNCEQEYFRPLVLGDHLTVSSVIESVSGEKRTGLGDGHFVTTRSDFHDQHGELVATMRFRILRFRPRRAGGSASAAGAAATAPTPTPAPAPAPAPPPGAPARPRRPRPAITEDNAFFFEGARAGKLLVQRCSGCGVLRHPPRPACDRCQSFEWEPVEASGRGAVFSYVVVHHPQVPAFDYPLPIAVVELEEGTRLVADLVGVEPADVHIGMPVAVEMVAVDDELTLPMFRPVSDGGH